MKTITSTMLNVLENYLVDQKNSYKRYHFSQGNFSSLYLWFVIWMFIHLMLNAFTDDDDTDDDCDY